MSSSPPCLSSLLHRAPSSPSRLSSLFHRASSSPPRLSSLLLGFRFVVAAPPVVAFHGFVARELLRSSRRLSRPVGASPIQSGPVRPGSIPVTSARSPVQLATSNGICTQRRQVTCRSLDKFDGRTGRARGRTRRIHRSTCGDLVASVRGSDAKLARPGDLPNAACGIRPAAGPASNGGGRSEGIPGALAAKT